MAMNNDNEAKSKAGVGAGYGPLTKSIDVDEALSLIQLSRELTDVSEWQEEALYRLPQASRQRRKDIIRDIKRKFLTIEGDRIIETPLQILLTLPAIDPRFRRDLLVAQYLRSTPLAWEAVRDVLLPHAEFNAKAKGIDTANKITVADWVDFLSGRLNTSTPSTVEKTRNHLTAHLTKFGLLEALPVKGDAIAKDFFAHFYQPDVRAFWFSLTQEFIDQGWTTRSERFICESSWTRIAYCTTPAYARFALDEAERHGLITMDFFGNEKQATLRGPEPFTRLVEVIRYA